MIVGIGVDTVDLTRFARSIERAPRLVDRVFTDAERGLPRASLAARFAAREAAVKALGGLHGLCLRDLAVARAHLGPPTFELDAHARSVLAALGVARLHLSITHDANLATAFVVAEGGAP